VGGIINFVTRAIPKNSRPMPAWAPSSTATAAMSRPRPAVCGRHQRGRPGRRAAVLGHARQRLARGQ
jgi:hypothetical protein